MSDLVAIAYKDLATAQEVAQNAAQLQKGHEIELDDMVVIERKQDGKVKLHQPSTAGVGRRVRRAVGRADRPAVLRAAVRHGDRRGRGRAPAGR